MVAPRGTLMLLAAVRAGETSQSMMYAVGESIRCESGKDTGFGLDFSSYPQECASNRGGSSSVQVKTYQEAFAASFDLSAREYAWLWHKPHARSAFICTR